MIKKKKTTSRQEEQQTTRKTPPPPEQDDDGDEEKGGSAANVFDNTRAQGSVEDGKYEAIYKEMVLQDSDEKGQSVRWKYVIISEGDMQGSEVAQFYKIFNSDMKTAGLGLPFLKKDLAVLGQPDVKFGDLEDTFKELMEDEDLGVNITVKNKDGFTNAYLNGICDDAELIANYREEHPF